jgi:TldD protein
MSASFHYSGYSRRDFVVASSSALAGVALGIMSHPLGAQALSSTQPVATLLPDIVDPARLRELALAAMEAAKSAGASFADIRIANRRIFQMDYTTPAAPPTSSIGFDYSYGIRVRVAGGWAFGYGADPTTDGVAETVRNAVVTARRLATVRGSASEFAAAPVVIGEWATPVTFDPFAVSPDEHAYMLGAYMSAITRVIGGVPAAHFYWLAETRVLASSEGSLITQHLAQARPRVTSGINPYSGTGVSLELMDLAPAEGAGFEIALGPALQDKIKARTEDAARLASYPNGNVEVGRYEAVLDGMSVGSIASATLMPALELDRVLGQTTNASGTSFLAPPDRILGQPMFAAALNVTSDRGLPYLGAAKWDDEGVETEPFPVIREGAVVDYFASRATVPALASWYAKQGKPVTSHGSAVAWLPTREPVGSAAHVSISPGAAGVTLDSLTKGRVNGVLLRGVAYANSDQQLSSGAIYPQLFEVKKGQITRRLRNAVIQFSTKKFWKSVTTMGDASSVEAYVSNGVNGQPWAPTIQPIMAPAAHMQELNVTALEDRSL